MTGSRPEAPGIPEAPLLAASFPFVQLYSVLCAWRALVLLATEGYDFHQFRKRSRVAKEEASDSPIRHDGYETVPEAPEPIDHFTQCLDTSTQEWKDNLEHQISELESYYAEVHRSEHTDAIEAASIRRQREDDTTWLRSWGLE